MAKRKATAEELEAQAESNGYKRGGAPVGCEVRCISKVGEAGGCGEDIDVEAQGILRNKSGRRQAVGGRRLDWSWFRRPFHSDCNYGDVKSGYPADRRRDRDVRTMQTAALEEQCLHHFSALFSKMLIAI